MRKNLRNLLIIVGALILIGLAFIITVPGDNQEPESVKPNTTQVDTLETTQTDTSDTTQQ